MNASRSREMDEPIAVKNRDRDISNWKNASRRSIDSFRVAIFFTQVFVACRSAHLRLTPRASMESRGLNFIIG